jgi:outer membrane protein assembly factor BamA
MNRQVFVSLFLIFFLRGLEAQTPSAYVAIGDIVVEGNKKTRTHFIIRELFFQEGDSLPAAELVNHLEFNRLQLMNTSLFARVEVSILQWDVEKREVDILIRVSEVWYIYPFPILELADRNFNTWWNDYDHSLRRINFGSNFYHRNLTGRRDELKAVLQFGFTKKYELVYNLPFFDRKQQWGLSFETSYTRNKEVNYATLEDRQQFFRQPDYLLLQKFRVGAAATLRRKRQVTHVWEAKRHHNAIDESVRDDLNPDYFLGDLHQRYTSLAYELIADTRDIRPYPMQGGLLRVRLQKDGLGGRDDVHALQIAVLGKTYVSFARRWSLEMVGGGRLAIIRQKQPFANSQALGYGIHYIRGYEYYVIDGMDYVYGKGSLRFQLLDRLVDWGPLVPVPNLRRMPYRVYLTLNNDLGFVNNPYYGEGNSLDNTLLWGGGLSIDFVVYYNKLFRLEFSRNRLGENGVFLHWATRF